MRIGKLITCLILLASWHLVPAQTVDEVVNHYLEKIGGVEKLRSIKGLKMEGIMTVSDLEIPFKQVLLTDGRQYNEISFMGNLIKQQVYDGDILWGMNFEDLSPEKATDEKKANLQLSINDFPDALVDYKKKNYQIEIMGKEMMDGREVIKMKIRKEDKWEEGRLIKDIAYYYFDVKSKLSLGQESLITSGENNGKTSLLRFGDYGLVGGIYLMPYTTVQYIGGQKTFELSIKKVELNPVVDEQEFAFPEK